MSSSNTGGLIPVLFCGVRSRVITLCRWRNPNYSCFMNNLSVGLGDSGNLDSTLLEGSSHDGRQGEDKAQSGG